MKTAAYIISDSNELIAYTNTNLKNGTKVEYAYERVEERLNADRDFNLVNASVGKISRAKKWEKIESENQVDFAVQINLDSKTSMTSPEFLIF